MARSRREKAQREAPGREGGRRSAAVQRAAALADLHREILGCARCPLWRTRISAVPGEGPADAAVMLVGEAPGRHEDAQGRPFVGAAGRLLDNLLASIDLRREEVYITNLVKSRPTDRRDGPNRPPAAIEVAACSPWLDRQLAIIRPRLVVTLGRHALDYFLPGRRISDVHGRPFVQGGRVILPLFHPAVALYGIQREILRRDFLQVRRTLDAIGRRGRGRDRRA